jgi:hypothetical protein
MILVENDPSIDPLALDELLLRLQSFKHKKPPGPDDINLELLKNGPPFFLEFLKIFKRLLEIWFYTK